MKIGRSSPFPYCCFFSSRILSDFGKLICVVLVEASGSNVFIYPVFGCYHSLFLYQLFVIRLLQTSKRHNFSVYWPFLAYESCVLTHQTFLLMFLGNLIYFWDQFYFYICLILYFSLYYSWSSTPKISPLYLQYIPLDRLNCQLSKWFSWIGDGEPYQLSWPSNAPRMRLYCHSPKP